MTIPVPFKDFNIPVNPRYGVYAEPSDEGTLSGLLRMAPATIGPAVRVFDCMFSDWTTPYAYMLIDPEGDGGVNLIMPGGASGFSVSDTGGYFIAASGDVQFSGNMTSGNVPAARITSGTLAVARAWAYTGGDVTSSAGSAVLTIANNAVSNAKLSDMAQATFKMRAAGAGTGDPIDGTAAQAKTALAITTSDVSGLGTMAVQASNNVAITGGFGIFNRACSMSSTGASLYVDNTGVSYTGDVVQILGNNATSANYYALRVYNNLGNAVGGIRGDAAYTTNAFVQAP